MLQHAPCFILQDSLLTCWLCHVLDHLHLLYSDRILNITKAWMVRNETSFYIWNWWNSVGLNQIWIGKNNYHSSLMANAWDIESIIDSWLFIVDMPKSIISYLSQPFLSFFSEVFITIILFHKFHILCKCYKDTAYVQANVIFKFGEKARNRTVHLLTLTETSSPLQLYLFWVNHFQDGMFSVIRQN